MSTSLNTSIKPQIQTSRRTEDPPPRYRVRDHASEQSVLAVALADDGHDGDHARARLRGERLTAPELVDLEVTLVWRRRMGVSQPAGLT